MKKAKMGQTDLFRVNLRMAKSVWENLSQTAVRHLKKLSDVEGLAVAGGDLQLLQGRWYVTHTGLLRLAQRKRCLGIETVLVERVSEPRSDRWVFKATVYKSSTSRRFIAYGDADPSNISPLVRGAELRVAETRAVNRALRKAYGIGICSVEELGSTRFTNSTPEHPQENRQHHNQNGSNNGQPRLRDQLCLLIRDHKLDPKLVKAYAADFCGTATLSGASRELVESFISHLSTVAKENRDGLVCKLNSYAQPTEAQP
jgi:hypothetical protein